MTRDDIIRMALEAGIIHPEMVDKTLERFAALVAAAEREKVAAWMIERSYVTGHGDTTEDLLKELEWQVKERVAAEREACLKIMRETPFSNWYAGDVDYAIRARGRDA